MRFNWKILDQMLMGEMETDDISLKCKEELGEFLHTHRFQVFSDESLQELAGVFSLSIGPAYEAQTGEKIPNVFCHVNLDEDEEELPING